jgi:hypothetical protein
MIAKYVWMAVIGPLIVAAPMALDHCSGSNSNPLDAGVKESSTSSGSSGGSSSGSGSSGSGSSSSSSSGGSTSSSSGAVEAGNGPPDSAIDGGGEGGNEGGSEASVCEAPDGGAACDPGIVACGDGGCMTSSSACCSNNSDSGVVESCQPNAVTCPSGGTRHQCDEAADCPSGFICCVYSPATGVLGATSCMQSCNTAMLQYQICRSDTECGQNADSGALKKCVLQTCTGMGRGGTMGPSATLEACAVAPTQGNPNNNGAYPACVAK